MAFALPKNPNTLQTSYAYRSSRTQRSTTPRYLTPSRSTLRPTSMGTSEMQATVPQPPASLRTIALISQFLFKAILISVMSIGFVYCASAIVGSSSSILLKILGLSVWSCGFVPLTYYLWNSKLSA